MSRRQQAFLAAALAALLAACGGAPDTGGPGPGEFANNPCAPVGTLQLAVAQTALIDCTNGGTTLTLAGNGASYLIVPQFATNLVVNQPVPYTLATGSLAAAVRSSERAASLRAGPVGPYPGLGFARDAGMLPGARQRDFEQSLLASARRQPIGDVMRIPAGRAELASPPTLGSVRSFHVRNSFTGQSWATVSAQLVYIGNSMLLYIDNAAPANGFTPSQLTAFGQLFDQTLYAIAANAFGQPSDVDADGHVIMLMSPVVNADTPQSSCQTEGYVAGFFDPVDFSASNGNSNQGEVFYSIVPDPLATVSCAHSVTSIGATIPATFLHELEHLINYSQHVVVNRGAAQSSWLDEGIAIVAEELGSLYYEQKCPPPACRMNPTQLYPDSSQGFIQGFFNDSYTYALRPDTASLTLHNDSENGFSWRGGDWALVRYLGDQFGNGFFRALMTGPPDGPTAIAAAAGRPFPSLFANFGLALYTDSFPGLPRSTAPAANRFVTRNLRQMWARLFATSGPSAGAPRAMPLLVAAITTDTTAVAMNPGAMSFWRLDTPASEATVSIRFAGPGGNTFSTALHAQLAIFRLPAGQ